ncbi:hypothetical protein J4423_04460 [Candidatus Pacearchaeota archaeon]|nr:hypothetical protein [Candidatus Pacearchaeota archaeon]
MRRLIKLLLFSLIFVTFLSFFVSAQSCATADDRIMRISAPTNAMGEVWNGAGSYGTDICYSTIFSRTYSGNNPHGCSPQTIGATNDVVHLSNPTNAHAETPDYNSNSPTASYVNNVVCYGDLRCRSITAGNCNTAGGEREVVRLSGTTGTNAHLGTPASATTYTTKICCSSANSGGGGIQGLSNPVWRYYDGTPILENTPICPNSYVTMNVGVGTGISGNVDFKLYEYDSLSSNDLIDLQFSGIVSNGQVNVTLNLSNQDVIDKLNLARDGSPNEAELFFVANQGQINSPNSVIVRYDGDTNRCSYSRPTSSIQAPVHKGIYFTGKTVDFVQGCTSQAGLLRYEWTITPQNGNIITRTEPRFNYTFTDAGQTNVKLKCTDLEGRFAITESQMLIVENARKTLAYINRPAFESFVYNSPPTTPNTLYFPKNVDFSASESFVVDINPNNPCPTVECLGGDCPLQTQNSPIGCTSANISLSNVPTLGNIDYTNLFFNWTFWSNSWSEQWSSYEGLGVKSGIISYDSVSNSVNDKHMSVFVNYTGSGVSASASFQRDFTLGRCLNNGNSYYGPNSDVRPTNVENDACKGVDGRAGTGDDCCAGGLRCMPGINSQMYSCQMPLNSVVKCEDFRNLSDCNSNSNPSIPLASYNRNPAACEFLECYWISSTSTCGVRSRQYTYNNQTGCTHSSNGCSLNDCVWTTTQTECINGMKTVNYTSESAPVSGCSFSQGCEQRDQVRIPCGSLSFELSFFGRIQFIITIISIAVFYFAFNIHRRKENEKRN